ncbi:MAG: glutamate racemase [Defluviitaleaceae bacterium]|nr:glutamate racemase [Defluviitaleaceae bacterium]
MEDFDNRPIGIFDSGVGGLTVLAKIKEVLPNESLIYFGDTANVPYGGKTPEQLLKYGQDIVRFLRSHDVKAVVMACGSTSSSVYNELAMENPDLLLVDVIRPGVKACVEMGLRNIGFIATATTIKSGLFGRLLKKQSPNADLLTKACPMFALMVEAGVTHGPVAKWVVETYIGQWRGKIDALVLGCTHYPLLTDILSPVLGGDIQYIDLATHTAQALKSRIRLNNGDTIPQYEYFVSGDAAAFSKTAHFLMQGDLSVAQIRL